MTVHYRPIRIAAAALCVSTALAFTHPAIAQSAEGTSFGAWTVRCETVEGSDVKNCIMQQNLVLKTGGQPVLQFAIGLAPDDGNPTVLLKLPLGIYLPPGIGIQIDDGAPASFPVERCDPDGCHAVMKLREATLDRLRRGKKLEIEVHDAERVPLSMPLTLAGFSEAYDLLSSSASASE